ncbi:MAG TPA: DUF2330 domain-containing protein [Enhygromyxa sp.]|nr:DUF2330 domain-containing protein [Enhygromyxa sp.]
MSFTARLVALATLAVATLALPSAAQACGGTFCDSGPTIMPVDQTGETIVFWIDETGPEPFTEAHIQIQYEGEAERFAWIIPVTAVPEVLVGSQALFDNLLQATVPLFVLQNGSIGDCGFSGLACASLGDLVAQGGGREAVEEGGDGGDDGPEILDRGFAGAFEYVTLTGDSVEEVVTWLEMAGYAQDEDAPPILEEYLQDGFVFVAVKLRSGADVDEIHPLAIRYAGIEPCIPIKLTRIAAVEDMAIRAMFLGDARVAPTNWPHVWLNHARLDFANLPSASYTEAVSMAVDEAGGRAFITEYAGTDAVVPTTGIHDVAWDVSAFAEIEATAVVDELAAQQLLDCTASECTFAHPQIEVLLETYLPPPPSVDAHEFWACLSCYEGLIDLDVWDPAAFASAFEQRVVQPGQHALDMLTDAEYLTRLFTVISPHEMIDDPLFHETSGLDDVDNVIGSTRVFDCGGGPTTVELPDGRQLALTDAGEMPDLQLPAAERIELIPAMGPPQVEVDNGPEIDAAIEAYNASRLTGPEPNLCSIRRASIEGVFTIFAVFGIAWLHRGRRRKRDLP